MAEKWYPVIDYSACIECGSCTGKCSHGVYDLTKAPVPVVVQPAACVDHCHGCGNLCPQGAITYVGDDTGWDPPNGVNQEEESGCCECGNDKSKEIRIEYLYLDLQTCDRCIGTDKVLEEVLEVISPTLEIAGYTVTYQKTEIETIQLAEQYRFLSSPTIRVNGHDICDTVKESDCGCCGEISGTSVDCRVFEYNGTSYEVPPKEMIAEAILKNIFNPVADCSCGGYELPQNLKTFFEGKVHKNCRCSCSEGCC